MNACIYNKYTQNTHILSKSTYILDAINHDSFLPSTSHKHTYIHTYSTQDFLQTFDNKFCPLFSLDLTQTQSIL